MNARNVARTTAIVAALVLVGGCPGDDAVSETGAASSSSGTTTNASTGTPATTSGSSGAATESGGGSSSTTASVDSSGTATMGATTEASTSDGSGSGSGSDGSSSGGSTDGGSGSGGATSTTTTGGMMCAAMGQSCAGGEMCCPGLMCCAGIPVPPGAEFCGSPCPISDYKRKRDFTEVDVDAVLERVAALPISEWSYRFEDPSIRHIGPMAQDFMASFQVGASDESIFVVDADGVSLAAIQALYARVRAAEAENAALHETIERLEARMHALETGAR